MEVLSASYMEVLSASLALCEQNSPYKGYVLQILMFCLLLAQTNFWIKCRVASDLRRNDAHVTSL